MAIGAGVLEDRRFFDFGDSTADSVQCATWLDVSTGA